MKIKRLQVVRCQTWRHRVSRVATNLAMMIEALAAIISIGSLRVDISLDVHIALSDWANKRR